MVINDQRLISELFEVSININNYMFKKEGFSSFSFHQFFNHGVAN